MKSFLFGLGVGVGLGVLFAPGRGEDTRRDLSERLNGVAEDAQRKAQKVARHLRDRLNDESDSDDSAELPPKKNQASETAEPATSSTERTSHALDFRLDETLIHSSASSGYRRSGGFACLCSARGPGLGSKAQVDPSRKFAICHNNLSQGFEKNH